MIKGKELLGRHVIDLNTGERLDSVRDIIFDHGANMVLGVVVTEGGSWLRRRDKVIPFSAVYSVGEDAVMLTSGQDAGTEEEQARMRELMAVGTNLVGMTLMTAEGEDLGKIGDVVFDEYSGRVEGYEVTGGIFADVAEGRSFVPAPESVQIGKDVAIVPASVAEDIRGQRGHRPPGNAERSRLEAEADPPRDEQAELAAQRQREYVVGRIAGANIALPDGTKIAVKGQPITEEQAEQARRSGRLMILANTSLSPEGEADWDRQPGLRAAPVPSPVAEEGAVEVTDQEGRLTTLPPVSDTEDPSTPTGKLVSGQVATESVLEPEPTEVLVPDQKGRLTAIQTGPETAQEEDRQEETVQEWVSERTIRVRDEQVVRLSEDAGQEPGFLERAKRWLDDRKEEFLHGSEERELIQVHEQRGAPLASASVRRDAESDAPEPAPAEASQTADTAAASALLQQPEPVMDSAVMEGAATRAEVPGGEQVIFRGPEPTLSTQGLSSEGMGRGSLHPQGDAPLPEEQPSAVSAADPLQPTGDAGDLSESAAELQEDLRQPAPTLSHAPGAPLGQRELSADPPQEQEAVGWADLELDLNLGPVADPTAPGLVLDSFSQQTVQAVAPPAEAVAPARQDRSGPQPPAPTTSPSSESFEQAIAQIVASAYGLPVSRTVHGPGGKVVLEAGDPVTPEVAERAKRLGVLRELLSAVQRG